MAYRLTDRQINERTLRELWPSWGSMHPRPAHASKQHNTNSTVDSTNFMFFKA
jgi:hypothetical protein